MIDIYVLKSNEYFVELNPVFYKGWLGIAELKPLSLYLTLSNAFLSMNNREIKSGSGFSLAMQWVASPLHE